MIINSEKLILNEEDLINFCKKCKKEQKKIVLASGVFDVLHEGHLKFLEEVRGYGDVLIVGINNDNFASKKGPNRPIQSENVRAYLIAGFKCVTCVHIYDCSDRDRPLISIVKPDVYLMSNSSAETKEDRQYKVDIMDKLGGKTIIVDEFSKAHSTSIIDKLMDTHNPVLIKEE